MAQNTSIEWTEVTWNPITGCTKISPGCMHCYAERMAYRFAGRNSFPSRPHHFDVTLHPQRLEQPMRWRKPRIAFVNSMSDLFHHNVPMDFIQQVFTVIRSAKAHTFQILTKRSERLLELDHEIEWPPNVWMGVSVENSDYTYRIDHLKETGARVKFVSLEPLLGPVFKLDLSKIDWVIVGGESGPEARSLKQEWVVSIRDQCKEASVAFFFKQWGGVNKKHNGRLLEGRTWDEMPPFVSGFVNEINST